MSDFQTTSSQETSAQSQPALVTPIIVYVLFIMNLVLPVIAHLIGLTLAFFAKDDDPESAARNNAHSHYVHAMSMLWKYVVMIFIGLFGAFFLANVAAIGAPVIILAHLWLCLRCGRGVMLALKGEAYPNPRRWGF